MGTSGGHGFGLRLGLSLGALAALGCGDGDRAGEASAKVFDPGPDPLEYEPHPVTPSIQRNISLIDDDAQFTRPFVPGHRTTMDGRVAVRVQGGPPGPERLAQNLSFYLFVPERLQEPILAGPPGAQILAETQPFDVPFPPALEEGVERLGHHAVCDPTLEFAVDGEQPNPYLCGPGNEHDCYDFTIISTTSTQARAQLWGTPVTVEVENPKTPTARIVNVVLGESVAGKVITLTQEWTEPAVTMDGRLLTGRYGRVPRDWTNPNTGETFSRNYDLAYSVLPDDREPCDVTGWQDFHPMSHAPYDPDMERYGLAAYPFRDTEGNLIPDGEDMGGTYPWVDREGANLFMTAVHGRLAEQSEEKYPRRCVVEGCELFKENVDWDRGFLVAGLWTHGKLVHVDGMINNMDWAVGVAPQTHSWVDLYRDEAGDEVPVRFGAGRFIDKLRYEGGPYPPGYTHNANILDSLQNLPNHKPEAQPITPRDVVWVMGTGVATEEIAFDDMLDPQAFIVSNMQASVTQLYDELGSLSIPHHHNGQVRELTAPLRFLASVTLKPELEEEIHIQNGATSLELNVPAYGLVETGTARVEPVALGGVEGRGFWLSGDNRIRYAVPAQQQPLDRAWYVGIFVDVRTTEGASRALLTFPDGSSVRLMDDGVVRYRAGEQILHEVALPPDARLHAGGWVHLGLRIAKGHREVTLLLNGLGLDRFSAPEPVFQLGEGELVVGRAEAGDAGVRGWIDDFKVLAHDVDPEVACNHARGTLIRIDTDETWKALSNEYPAWAHDEVAAAAGEEVGASYACYHDYRSDYAAHLGNIPAGTVSLREAITFPEGPLRAGAPRPDSSQNPFCLSCHTPQGKGGLSVEALELDPGLAAEDDPRRQPLQPPRRVFGNIPANWIAAAAGPGSPSDPVQAPEAGLVIDPWVLPAAN